MNHSKAILIVAAMSLMAAVGCTGQKRIEGVEVPTQPPPEEVAVAQPAVPPPPPAVPTAEPTVAPPPVVAEAPTAEPTPEAPPPPAANPCNQYIVVKGDTLWDISGTSGAYHDNFQWPLIFKANRDLITDPDLIYPKQEFCIRQDFTPEEIAKSRKDASDTPVYVPHTKPREVLPLNYF